MIIGEVDMVMRDRSGHCNRHCLEWVVWADLLPIGRERIFDTGKICTFEMGDIFQWATQAGGSGEPNIRSPNISDNHHHITMFPYPCAPSPAEYHEYAAAAVRSQATPLWPRL